jgi:hypothetical protein
MKLVETLVVRGAEDDVLAAHLAFQLAAGVDLVLAVGDGSPELLAPYVREGKVQVVGDARAAAADSGADWVIESAPDEFWWPRGESLKDVLAPIPPRYTTVQALRREFVPAPGAEPFAERMTVRRSFLETPPDEDPASLLRPVHRVGAAPGRVPLRAWYPIEVLHFPDRGTVAPGPGLVEDTRLRDALRTLREAGGISFRTPDVVDDASYAVECAAVGEVDLPRLERYVEELEQRVAWLEQRLWPRLLRRLTGFARR